MSEKQIARELGITIHTVHNNVKQIYGRFNVSSRGELCAKIWRGSIFSAQVIGAAARAGMHGRLDDILHNTPSATKDHARACYEAATLHGERGNLAQAIRWMNRAVSMRPAVVEFRVNLAAYLGRAGRFQEALAHLTEALRLKDSMPEVHNNIGAALEQLGRPAEAIGPYKRAIALRGDYAEAYCNLGNALRATGAIGRASSAYLSALVRQPRYAKAYAGSAECAVERGDAAEAIRLYRQAVELDPGSASLRSALLYTLHYSDEYTPDQLFKEHVEWGRQFGSPTNDSGHPAASYERRPGERLRIGYVSPNLREHTVTKFIAAALEHHDDEKFEITCYSDASTTDAVTARLKDVVEHWRDTAALSDDKLEQVIRGDKIDILVDLRGHGGGNRLTLFARKPISVQVNMIGYFDTTALSTMDWRITDAYQDPMGVSERYHTERLFRLDGGCWCYSPSEDAPPVAEEPPVVRNGHVTFGSLNKIVKVSRSCAQAWARVLEAVPKSRLLLTVAEGDADRVVRDRLAGWGLDPNRIDIVAKAASPRDYLERFGCIDVALDTFPFNGITTTCDGLWMGVPAVSLAGTTTVSRSGRSILHAAGLGELAADTPEQFVRVGSELAIDVDRLRGFRREMRGRLRASPLLAHRRFAAGLEQAYRHMAAS